MDSSSHAQIFAAPSPPKKKIIKRHSSLIRREWVWTIIIVFIEHKKQKKYPERKLCDSEGERLSISKCQVNSMEKVDK